MPPTGAKTIIEKDKRGVCLNVGCIPSKALINQAEIYRNRDQLENMGIRLDESGFDYSKVFKKSRKAANTLAKGVEYLLKKNKVELIMGEGFIESPNRVKVGDRSLGAKNIIIATGSSPRQIPGFPIDETKVLSSTGALMLEELPKDIIILGAGAIGMEFAHILNSFGVEVCVVEMMDSILPLEDKEAARVLHRALQKRGIKFHTSTKAISRKRIGRIVILRMPKVTGRGKGVREILVVGGRQPTPGIGLRTGTETISLNHG